MNRLTPSTKKMPFLSLLALIGLLLAAAPLMAYDVYLVAKPFNKTMPGGEVVPMWGFAVDADSNLATDGGETPASPGPVLRVPPAEASLVIHLRNDLTWPVSIVIPGQIAALSPVRFTDAQGRSRVEGFTNEAAPAGGTADYTWPSFRPGSFLYMTGSHPSVGVQMGLFGAAVKDASAGFAYSGNPHIDASYNNEAILFLSEVDPELHQAVSLGQYGAPPYTSTIDYLARYYLINGSPYPGAALILNHAVSPGDRLLIRMFNAGLETHALALKGAYIDVIAEDGNMPPYPDSRTTVLVAPQKTHDAVFVPPADGRYPIFDRMLGLSNNRTPGGGMLVYLNVSTAAADIFGPLAYDLVAITNPTNGLPSVTLNGTASDVNQGGSNIAAAEWWQGPDPGVGAATAMTAADGSFNSPTEGIRGTINVTGLPRGLYTIFARSKDAAGNWGGYSSLYLRVAGADARGPVTSNVVALPNPTKGATSVTLTATVDDTLTGGNVITAAEWWRGVDPGVGNGTAMAASDGLFNSQIEDVTAAINVSAWAPNNYTLRVRGKDAGGAWGTPVSVVLVVSTGDGTGPLTTGPAVAPSPNFGVSPVTLTATADDTTTGNSPIARAEWWAGLDPGVGAGTPMSATDGFFNSPVEGIRAFINVTSWATGDYILSIRSRDVNGNWGAAVTIVLQIRPADTQGPLTTGAAANPNPTNAAPLVTLTATANDSAKGNSNIAAAEWWQGVDPGFGNGTAMTASDGLFNSPVEGVTSQINVSTALPGDFIINFRSKDAANNWGPTVNVILRVTGPDTQRPVTRNVVATPNPTNGSPTVTLTAVGDDSGTGNSNIAAAEWWTGVDPGFGLATAMSAADGAFNSPIEGLTAGINVSGWSPGQHTIYVRSKDAAGNWGQPGTTSLQVVAPPQQDTQGPITTGVTATPNPTGGSATITLQALEDDRTRGLSNIAAAEWWMPPDPGLGRGNTMTAVDGAFNSPLELVTATINISTWQPGLYNILVRGKDAAGNWGTASFVTLRVTTTPGQTDTVVIVLTKHDANVIEVAATTTALPPGTAVLTAYANYGTTSLPLGQLVWLQSNQYRAKFVTPFSFIKPDSVTVYSSGGGVDTKTVPYP